MVNPKATKTFNILFPILFRSSRKQEWGAENPSEVVNKFRNYEI